MSWLYGSVLSSSVKGRLLLKNCFSQRLPKVTVANICPSRRASHAEVFIEGCLIQHSFSPDAIVQYCWEETIASGWNSDKKVFYYIKPFKVRIFVNSTPSGETQFYSIMNFTSTLNTFMSKWYIQAIYLRHKSVPESKPMFIIVCTLYGMAKWWT